MAIKGFRSYTCDLDLNWNLFADVDDDKAKTLFLIISFCLWRCNATPFILTGDFPCTVTAVPGEFGKEFELERLSSRSERRVVMDFAEPELIEPLPKI